ncbi:MAG: hypothetical protein H6700_01980 [Myxococcales bacterium]|nr:hypothetical protein [Myxococcales bacterium]MCB9530514.1 hypothetical protein [Myxococcales bacterium]
MGRAHNVANRNRSAAHAIEDPRLRALDDAIESGKLSPAEEAEARQLRAQLESRADSVYAHTRNGDDLARLTQTAADVDRFLADLGVDEADGSGGADCASGTGSADSKGDPGSIEDNLSDGSSLLRLYESDPDEFARQWRELSSEDRTLAMHSLQSAANLEAQITTLFTNIMQAQHQAIMAIARNLSA